MLRLKVKVNNTVVSDEKIYKTAIEMTQLDLTSFEKAVELSRKAKGDIELACQLLFEEQAKNSKQ